MSVRSRELSQFGSFIYIDDATRNVGIATTESTYVGIGTANPTEKFDVGGNARIRGDLIVDGNFDYTFDSNLSLDGDISISGVLTAASFRTTSGLALTSFDSWQASESNIYRLGNVGIGTTVSTERLNVNGNIGASGTVSATRFISTVTATAPFTVSSSIVVQNLNADLLRGSAGPTGTIVGTTDSQTLTNKTLTSPTITGGIATNVGIYSGTINNAIVPVGAAISFGNVKLSGLTTTVSYQLYLPLANGSLISTTSSGIITTGVYGDLSITGGKIADATITGAKIAGLTITGANISDSTISTSKLSSSTISGIQLGNNLNSLNFTGSYWSGGTSYNGSSAVNVSLSATTVTTGNTLVARNASGETNLTKIFFRDLDGTSLDGSAINNSTLKAFSIIAPSGGKVAINSNSINSSYELNVVGSINFTGSLYQNGTLFVSGGGGGDSLWGPATGGITTTANVGIKNATPTSALDVTGDVRISGITTSANFNTGGEYRIGGSSVLNSNTLGSGIITSFLTSVGTLAKLTVGTGGINIASGVVTATTFNGELNGNASTATQTIATVTGTGVADLVSGNMATNDYFRIRIGGTGVSDEGFVEIATADNGNEPIYVRQYPGTGGFNGAPRTLTLLDGSGNTAFPGIVTATDYRIAGNVVLGSTTLGSGVLNSSLTSVGTLTKLNVSGVTSTSGLNATGVSTVKDLRINSVAEETFLVQSAGTNPVTINYNTGGGNIAICTNPTSNFAINVVGIPTDSSFDNNSITFSAIVLQGSTARVPSAISFNGRTMTVKYPGAVSPTGSLSGSWDIFNFTGINTVGSASTTANYTVLGIVNGNFK